MICPACGKENPNHAIYCLSCRASLVPGLTTAPGETTAVLRQRTRERRRRLLLPLVVGLIVLAATAAVVVYALSARENRRAQRYQELSREVNEVAADFDRTNQTIGDLMNEQPVEQASLDELKGFWRRMLALVDTYQNDAEKMASLLETIDREQVANSPTELRQIRILKESYDYRKEQGGKLREMCDTILNFDPGTGDPVEFRAKLERLQQENAELDRRASQLRDSIGQQ